MKPSSQDKQTRMLESSPEHLICSLALPTIISMLVTTFYNMADTFFVTKLSSSATSATGAVSVVFSYMAIVQAFGFFFGHGSGNFISRELGKNNTREAEKMAATGFFSALFFGFFLMIVGLLFLEPMARFLGATDTILPYAKTYLAIILLVTPYMTAALVLNNQLRFQGNAMFAMIGITAGGLLNVALDPLLMFVFDLGIAGAAIATSFSQLVSFILLYIGTVRSDNLKIRRKNFSPSWKNYRILFNGGVPSLARQGLSSVANIVLNWVAHPYGDAAIAALAICSKLMGFASSVLIGFGQGFQPVCGFNYGAGRYDRVIRSFWFCVRTAFVGLLLVSATGYLFAEPLVGLFKTDDPQVALLAAKTLRWQVLTLPTSCWVVLANMMLQTIGQAGKATVLAMARQGLMFIPAVLILPLFLKLNGILCAQAVADLLSFLLALPLTISVLRDMQRRLSDAA